MRVAVVAVIAACGGSKPPPPKPPPEPVRQTRRIPVEDTEPDDGVEIVAAHGHMDPAVVEAGLAPHKAELSECYTARVGKRRWLGGHVTLHWDINKSGEVTAVKLAESDLGAWPIEKCLLDIARAATFGKPIGGDADFTVPLDFTAKGKATPLDEDLANKAVSRTLAKLDECGRAKGVKGGNPSDVTITLYVGPQGKTQSVGFASPKSVLDDAWVDCAEKHAFAWKLPDPKGAIAKVALHYR
jgi:TonB family protein